MDHELLPFCPTFGWLPCGYDWSDVGRCKVFGAAVAMLYDIEGGPEKFAEPDDMLSEPIAVLGKPPFTMFEVVGVEAALPGSAPDFAAAACDFFRCAAGLDK